MKWLIGVTFALSLFMSAPAFAEDGAGERAHQAPLLNPIAHICLKPASGDQPGEETVLDLKDWQGQACPPGQMAFLDVEPSMEYRAEALTGIPAPQPYNSQSNK